MNPDVDAKTPGDELGTYSVRGELEGDTCQSPALDTPQQWDFELKLSRRGSALYWLNGREAIVGDLDGSGAFTFDTRVVLELDGRRGAAPGCTVVRRDSASGTLSDTGDSFRASLLFSYEARADSSCEYTIDPEAAPPMPLPCSIAYQLRAERLDSGE
jgi:hypothetical protein